MTEAAKLSQSLSSKPNPKARKVSTKPRFISIKELNNIKQDVRSLEKLIVRLKKIVNNV